MIYLLDATIYAELFVFDCEQSEARELEIEWTEKPIETGATRTDYRVAKSEKFTVEGIVTCWPLGLAKDPTRLATADKALRALANLGQSVTLITDTWVEEVCISKVSARRAAGDAEQMTISIELVPLTTTTPTTTTVPASRLKPSVKAGSALQPKGGAGATAPPSAPAASAAKKLSDGDQWARQQALAAGKVFIPL
jgi:hypothetical protein